MIHFDDHIFQMGWFNHQPDMISILDRVRPHGFPMVLICLDNQLPTVSGGYKMSLPQGGQDEIKAKGWSICRGIPRSQMPGNIPKPMKAV